MAARLIDTATVLTLLWVLVVLRVLWFMGSLSTAVAPEPWGRAFAPAMSFVLLSAVYEVVFLSRSSGQTPGKDIMNVRVISAGGERAVPIGRAVLRWVPLGVVPLIQPLWLAGAVVPIVGATALARGRRSITDLGARTSVVSYDRDHEDPSSRRPVSRRRRRREAEAEVQGVSTPDGGSVGYIWR